MKKERFFADPGFFNYFSALARPSIFVLAPTTAAASFKRADGR